MWMPAVDKASSLFFAEQRRPAKQWACLDGLFLCQAFNSSLAIWQRKITRELNRKASGHLHTRDQTTHLPKNGAASTNQAGAGVSPLSQWRKHCLSFNSLEHISIIIFEASQLTVCGMWYCGIHQLKFVIQEFFLTAFLNENLLKVSAHTFCEWTQ